MLRCTAFLALAVAASAQAAPVRGIRALVSDPIAPRGSVLMVQLTADHAGDNWPATLTLQLGDGTELEGVVAWVGPAAIARERRWTDDPRGLAIRAIQPTDNSAVTTSGAPYLLAHVPNFVTGELKLDRQTLRPVWIDLPEQGAYAQQLERISAPNRPDPDSPFEYWRWVVMAQQLSMNPPDLRTFDEPAALMAEHLASLWRVALARLDSIDADLALRVRTMLTRTATDRGEPFAVWVADPTATGSLLTELVSTRESDRIVAEYVHLWADEHDKAMIWPEADYDASLRLAVVETGSQRKDMSVRWPGSMQSPTRVTVEPNVLMRVLCTKPRLVDDPIPAVYGRQPTRGETVVMQLAGAETELPLRPRKYSVVPPGVFLAELGPPLSLAEAQTLRRIPSRTDQATLVSIRKLNSRWEVFVDCRRPAMTEASAKPKDLPESVVAFDALRGVEAITILVGPEAMEEGPGAILTVPEEGWPRVYFGVQDGSLQVHRRSFADRWYARIVLPDGWLPHIDLTPALLGFIRTHGESQAIETGPNSNVPWRTEPGRVALDLSDWDGAAAPK